MRYASVCDGIGAAHVAWRPLGWQCVWTSEIEAFPIAVVEHHFGYRNLGDMTAITQEAVDGAGAVDLLVGGTPCQSFSVAGLRGGLDDPRGNLALRFVQLAAVMRPRWVVWENVPGVFSSGKGRDFGTFLGALEQLGYGWAYRTLDAQWFGVAQRRRRVFVVCHLGDWRRGAAVLFERESMRGDPPTRGTAGQDVAGSITASFGRNGGAANDDLDARRLIAFTGDGVIADPISAHEARTYTHEVTTFRLHNCVGQPFTKSKRAQSASDDETWVPGQVAPTQNQFDVGDTRATTVVAFTQNSRDEVRQINGDGQIAGALSAEAGMHTTNYIAFANRTRDGIKVPEVMKYGVTPALTDPGAGGRSDAVNVACGMAVRRLTPRECERLQGFPDDYTAITYRGKPAADGPRYRALGNSMAVPVMRWIGDRLAKVEALA